MHIFFFLSALFVCIDGILLNTRHREVGNVREDDYFVIFFFFFVAYVPVSLLVLVVILILCFVGKSSLYL